MANNCILVNLQSLKLTYSYLMGGYILQCTTIYSVVIQYTLKYSLFETEVGDSHKYKYLNGNIENIEHSKHSYYVQNY